MISQQDILSNPEHLQRVQELRTSNPTLNDNDLVMAYNAMIDKGMVPNTYTKAQEAGNMSPEAGAIKAVAGANTAKKGWNAANDYLKYDQYGMTKPTSATEGLSVIDRFKNVTNLAENKGIKSLNQSLLSNDKTATTVLKKGDRVVNNIFEGANKLLKTAKKTGVTDDVLAAGTELIKKELPGMADDVAALTFKQLLKEGTPGITKVLARVAGAGFKTAGKLLGPAGFLLGAAFDVYDTVQESKEGKLKEGRGLVRFLDKTLLGILPNERSMKSDEELAKTKPQAGNKAPVLGTASAFAK